jgi:hypothetical protein
MTYTRGSRYSFWNSWGWALWRPKHVEFDVAVNKCLHTDASSWSFLLTMNMNNLFSVVQFEIIAHKCYLYFTSSKYRYLTWLLKIYYLEFNFFVLPCLQWDPISCILFENLCVNAIWQSLSWKLRVSWLNDIFSALYGTWRFNCVFRCLVVVPVWGQINVVYKLICPSSKH